ARNRGLAVHHVMVHEVSGKLLVALDLEVDGQLSLGAAHDIASALEAAIAEELGTEVEVDTHIEPLQPYGQGGRDASGERGAGVIEWVVQFEPEDTTAAPQKACWYERPSFWE